MNLKLWHERQTEPIHVEHEPTSEQRDEIGWRAAVGLPIRVITEGSRDAFRISRVLLHGGMMEVTIIVPLWMWNHWIPRVIPIWCPLYLTALGEYRHETS